MKKIISVLLILSMALAMAVVLVYAEESGVIVTETKVNNEKVWHITGSGVIKRSDLPLTGNYGYADRIILDGDFTGIAGGAFMRVSAKEFILNDGLEYIGSSAFYDSDGFEYIEIPDSVTKIGISAFAESNLISIKLPESLTELKNGTFKYCHRLKEITIPETVRSIGDYAFYDCTRLHSISMGENIEYVGYNAFDKTIWFENLDNEYYQGNVLLKCYTGEEPYEAKIKEGTEFIYNQAFSPSIKSVIMPDSVTGIGTYLFDDCTNLERVVLSDGLKELPENAFYDCTALKEIEIPKGVEYICSSIKDTPWYETLPETTVINKNLLKCKISENGVATVPYGVKNIMGKIFKENDDLKRVVLPDSVERIGQSAFYECSSLTDINIPEGIKRIESSAFCRCSKLVIDGLYLREAEYIGSGAFDEVGVTEELRIGKNIKEIGKYAFETTDISSVVIDTPDEPFVLGTGAFRSCENLQTVRMPGFTSSSYGEEFFMNCTALKSIEIGEGLETVYKQMFQGCTALEEVTLPESVKQIQESAFENCTSLQNIELPQGVSNIELNAFKECKALKSVIIPEAMNAISESTFIGCSSLASVTLHGNIATIGESAFVDCTALCEVSLPEGVKDIGNSAFRNTSLTTLTLPESIEYIRSMAFAGTKLSEVTIPDGIKNTGANIFDNIENTVHIYASSEVKAIDSRAFKGNDIVVHAPRDSKAYFAAARAGADIVLAKEDRIGEVYNSIITTDIVTTMNGNAINAYSVSGKTIILVRDLESIGFDVSFDEEARIAYARYNPDKEMMPDKAVVLPDDKVIYTDITVEINGVSIGGFNIGGYMAVVAEDMGKYIPDISCTWVKSERALKMLASPELATRDYFIEEYARLKGLVPTNTSKYFSDAKSKYTDALVDNGIILTKDYIGLFYPDSALTVYLFATFAGRELYAEDEYEYWAYRKKCYTIPEIDYTDIPIYVQSYITRLYEDGIFAIENINGVNTIDTTRVMTKSEVTAALEKIIPQ